MIFEYQIFNLHYFERCNYMDRNSYLNDIKYAFEVHPIVAILGPRQVGKTTLAQNYAKEHGVNFLTNYFDLESLQDFSPLNSPEATLSLLKGLIVIDEVQLLPDLFPRLRVLIDKFSATQKYLLLGSASRELVQNSSESLAGRIQYIECFPFSYSEVKNIEVLWLRGGFPKAYLQSDDYKAFVWLENYIRSFLERDIPALGIRLPTMEIRRFWYMLAHYHGQELNYSDLAVSLSLSHTTLKRYIDLLSATLIIRQLQPWYQNIGKRQVKSPKLYFRDSGIFHQMLGINSLAQLIHNPKLGASFEGFVIEEIIKHYKIRPEDAFFWKVHSGAEIDLLLLYKGKKIGFEIKYSDKPILTNSLKVAAEILKLDQAFLIYRGEKTINLAPNIIALSLQNLLDNYDLN